MMMMMMMMMILASVLIRLRNRKDGFVCTYELLTCDVCRITTNGITCEGLWYGNKQERERSCMCLFPPFHCEIVSKCNSCCTHGTEFKCSNTWVRRDGDRANNLAQLPSKIDLADHLDRH